MRLELKGHGRPVGRDHWETKREALLEALRWLYQRGFDLCGGDITRSREDVAGGELWGTAETLLDFLGERLPEEEDELRHIFGGDENAGYLAAQIRYEMEYVAVLALELGLLATAAGLRDHMADLLRGEKVHEGAARGHEAVHGSPHEKQARWTRYQREADSLRAANPGASWAAICRWAAARLKVSAKTIQRRCTDPKKKS